MLINCSCTTSIDNSLFEFTKRPRRSKTDAHSHLLESTYRERCDGFACNESISVSFPAPTSSTDLNSNNDKTYKVTTTIESLRTTQSITLLDCNAFWVSGRRRRRGMKNNRTRIRARENRMKPLLRTSFLGTRPSCLPPPPPETVILHRQPTGRALKGAAQ